MQQSQTGHGLPGLPQQTTSWSTPYMAPTQDDFMNNEWNAQLPMAAASPLPDLRMIGFVSATQFGD